jgi:hypothetical protein
MSNFNKLVFIIAHKFIRGYVSYTKYYVDNINKFYDGALIIIVDNNSLNKNDIFSTLTDYNNVILLDNDITSKFELGAYQVGIRYLIERGLIENYDYCIMTQDNFIIKNRYDFKNFYDKEIYACPINSFYPDGACAEIFKSTLIKLNLYDNLNKINFCWCCSFVVHTSKLLQLYNYLVNIVIKIRDESCASERYLARILLELNNGKCCESIDGDIRKLKYNCWTVDLFANQATYFAKRVQQKNENTKE